MKTNLIYGSIIILLMISYKALPAQPGITFHTDLGENNVSDGLFIKSVLSGHYRFGKNKIETGFRYDLKNYNASFFSGYKITATRNLSSTKNLIELEGFYLRTFSSELLSEMNLGCHLDIKFRRFALTTGTDFRTYSFRERALKDSEMEENNQKIHENFILLYSFSYYLNPYDDYWNIGLSVTNNDKFSINQETNPLLFLRGVYNPSSHLGLFTDFCYKTAGICNLTVNHFGFFLRTGIKWNVN